MYDWTHPDSRRPANKSTFVSQEDCKQAIGMRSCRASGQGEFPRTVLSFPLPRAQNRGKPLIGSSRPPSSLRGVPAPGLGVSVLWPHPAGKQRPGATPPPSSQTRGGGPCPLLQDLGVGAPGSDISSLKVSLLTLAYFSTSLPYYANPRFWPPALMARFFVGSSCMLTSVQLFVASFQLDGQSRLGQGSGLKPAREGWACWQLADTLPHSSVPGPDASGGLD
ncbi:uncharacterized protein LOC128628134 [Artibeus jamaicensis]|uniref:uncharacterized protein LOC128628134 n=1 Tax=Artibeus jamaicensis TaxID=9417 RepID=UPI00235A5099|nr:uncharacterized protein LOC128628134 [Artibeus jamaicensis]